MEFSHSSFYGQRIFRYFGNFWNISAFFYIVSAFSCSLFALLPLALRFTNGKELHFWGICGVLWEGNKGTDKEPRSGGRRDLSDSYVFW